MKKLNKRLIFLLLCIFLVAPLFYSIDTTKTSPELVIATEALEKQQSSNTEKAQLSESNQETEPEQQPEQKQEPQPQQQPESKSTPEIKQQINTSTSTVRDRKFRLNNGTYKTGGEIVDYVKGNYNGLKLWNAFNEKYGAEVANTAAITLFYENGTLWEYTTGVCSAKHRINGDYRNCNYADINSAGFDAGLKQINTWYQRHRIAKLGGPNCQQSNSRDRSDPCVQLLIAWLHDVDNNIKITLDIYRDSGFNAWYGYRRAFTQ